MKHVGLNVAADPLFTVAYTGVDGALVIVSADDPGMASSQNEQDNRRYAVAAGVPMLEPSDSQEAYDFTLAAIEISERWRIPVLLRMTTRVCHGQGHRPRAPAAAAAARAAFRARHAGRNHDPANARPAHRRLRQKLAEIELWNESSPAQPGDRRRSRNSASSPPVSPSCTRARPRRDASRPEARVHHPLADAKNRRIRRQR
jgi:indolepyruvate ferredoxin oxidoreductase, alpha subunit